jgi:cyanophycinase
VQHSTNYANKRSIKLGGLLERLLHMMSRSDTVLQLETQFLEQRMPEITKAAVMVIGGAEDKVHGRQILQVFFNRSGSTNARIAIIPSASREPAVIGSRYHDIFHDMGAQDVEVLDIRDREQGEHLEWLDYIKDCTGVFMTGGDQLRLCGLLTDTPIMEKVRMRAQLGEITLAGTSAGAAVMGKHMIAGGGSGSAFP